MLPPVNVKIMFWPTAMRSVSLTSGTHLGPTGMFHVTSLTRGPSQQLTIVDGHTSATRGKYDLIPRSHLSVFQAEAPVPCICIQQELQELPSYTRRHRIAFPSPVPSLKATVDASQPPVHLPVHVPFNRFPHLRQLTDRQGKNLAIAFSLEPLRKYYPSLLPLLQVPLLL